MSRKKMLVLIDGSALAFRSFYALFTSGMRRSDGTPTWAIFGFMKALFDLVEKIGPDMMAVCFDTKEPTFRHERFDDYKANRAEMPDDLAVQWPIIKKGVEKLGVPLYEQPGFEADDLIGTAAKKAEDDGLDVAILTGDQDAFQLLDGTIQVLMPGRDGLVNYGRQEVFDKLGVWPEQVVDYKGLCGDTSDNIPGIRGIGPKTAVSLLSRFETIEGIYQHLDEVEKKGVKKKLEEGKDAAFDCRDLATIRLNVDFDLNFDDCKVEMPRLQELVAYLQELEFNSMLRRLPKALASFNDGVEPEIDPELLKPAARTGKNGSETAAPAIKLGDLEAEVVRTDEDLSRVLKEVAGQAILCVDLETTSVKSLECEIVGYALAWLPGSKTDKKGRLDFKGAKGQVKTAYIPVMHQGEATLDPEQVKNKLKPYLEDPKIGKVAQNAKYETNVLSRIDVKFGPIAFDPMLASYVENPDNKHGLKDQSERIFNHEMVKITDLIGTGRKQLTMDLVPVERVAPYAADDARVALELARYYHDRLDEEQGFLLYEMEQPLSTVLAKMEQAGVSLDTKYLEKFSKELKADIERLEQEIHELAGREFKISSPKQLQEVLFTDLSLPPQKKTKSGYSTDATVLEVLAEKHAIIPKIIEFRQLTKLLSTYVDALPRQISGYDNRLHGEFNQAHTSTGRLSSSNPNLQNIPIRTEIGRRIRRAFVPAGDSLLLLAADYSQIELRLLAHMSGDETLIDAFQKDQDIHARTAQEIFDVPIEDVDSDMRRIGKTINFSLIYQQGAYSTAQDLGISVGEARSFIDKYFARYPRVKSFMESLLKEARKNGYVSTLWGRRRYFRNLNDRNDIIRKAEERAACNAPLQGSAADLMKLAMVRLDRELAEKGLSARLILQVHDEVVLEVPEDEMEATRQIVLDSMHYDQPLKVPLKVDMGTGGSWMDLK